MATTFYKGDMLLTATMMALLADPMPYILRDRGDRIEFEIDDAVPPSRAYFLGVRTSELLKVLRSVMIEHEKKHPRTS